MMKTWVHSSLLLCSTICVAAAFVPNINKAGRLFGQPVVSSTRVVESERVVSRQQLLTQQPLLVTELRSKNDDEEEKDDDEKKENPYADFPENPELEFIDYSDPEYVVDQGVTDEFFDGADAAIMAKAESREQSKEEVEAEIEEMREDRRRRNDEYQFQTYFAEVLKSGDEYKGEWTIYKTSTFLDGMKDEAVDANGLPRLVKVKRPLKVISKGYKIPVASIKDPKFAVDGERICHEERAVSDEESDPYKDYEDEIDTDSGFGRHNDDDDVSSAAATSDAAEKDSSADENNENMNFEDQQTEEEFMKAKYCPDQLSSYDFRGHQGNMVVGNGYTICNSIPLDKDAPPSTLIGPFSEHRVELGIQSNLLRFRIKLDYRMMDEDKEAYTSDDSTPIPALHLKSMAVCRETKEMWPPQEGKYKTSVDRAIANSLSGLPGAEGGLYDPPPVGDDDQAGRYMLLDLEGRATVLFPYMLDQDPNAFDGNGWVTSLDWSPDNFRYQVDRKVKGGLEIMTLRTLELSEVQSADAQQYRPSDEGQNMRQ